MDFFKKVSLKDIIGDEDFFKPRKMDIMKEENFVFHLTSETGNMVNQNQLEEETEIDFEKQKQIE